MWSLTAAQELKDRPMHPQEGRVKESAQCANLTQVGVSVGITTERGLKPVRLKSQKLTIEEIPLQRQLRQLLKT